MTAVIDTLAVRDLTKIFRIKTGGFRQSDLRAVDGVDISISPGRTLAVVGESGSGKTTLARLILRLLEPTRGTVLLEDVDITGMEGAALEEKRARMQIVFQDPYDSLSPWQTVGRTVAEPLLLHQNLSKQQAAEPVAAMLERVGLSPEHARRYPHELSGGQAQRVGIARAMITNPALVVLDEPTSSLDMSVQSQILLLLQSLQEERNISYLFISHDLTVVRYIAHDLAVMYLGKVVEAGPAAHIFASPRHPYTEALLKAAPRPDPAHKTEHVYLVGEQPSALDRAPGCPLYGRCPIAEDVCADTPPRAGGYRSGAPRRLLETNLNLRVATDIGGTFTDVVVYDPNLERYTTAKAPSRGDDLAAGVMDALELVIDDPSGIESFVHGSTVGLNAFLQRRGERVILLATKGAGDVYHIARGNRNGHVRHPLPQTRSAHPPPGHHPHRRAARLRRQ